MKLSILGLSLLLLQACSSPSQSNENPPNKAQTAAFQLLTKNEAAQALVLDTCEFFFEKITPLEIEIQTQGAVKNADRQALIEPYKQFIIKDLADFSEAEKALTQKAMEKALQLCEVAGIRLQDLPKSIELIKTQGNYYGPGVFFTRNASIVLPSSNLDEQEPLTKVLVHEIFHIYSRYQTEKRQALYQAIGFEPLQGLLLNDFLIKRALYNPDGVNLRYAIKVKDPEGKEIEVVPAIISKHSGYVEGMPFFQYINFRLFPIERHDSGIGQVLPQHLGYEANQVDGFFEQIGRNTGYIIHPDEILADNFVLLAYRKEKPEQIAGLSAEGQKLLQRIEAILKQ